MKRIFIVRHGKTQWNLEKRLQGAGADSPLLTDDLTQYQQLADYLNTYHFVAAYSSPLERSMHTGRIVAKWLTNSPALTVQPVAGLTEISFGQWEGHTRDELVRDHLELFKKMSRRENDPGLTKLGVENFNDARHRFAQAVRTIAETLGPDDNVLVFGHGGINQLGIKELTQNEHLLGLKNLSTSIVTEHDGGFALDVYNQTAYLDNVNLNEGNVSIL